MTLTFTPTGPNVSYSPKVANAAGAVQTGYDTQAVYAVEGLGGIPLARENGGNLDAILTALGGIKTAIQAQIELTDLFVMDASTGNPTSGLYFVRETSVNEGTGAKVTSILNLDGSTPNPAPALANLTPVKSAAQMTSEATFYDVKTAGTGYAVGDVVARVLLTNTTTNTIVAVWQNLTQGTNIATPTLANLVEQTSSTATLLQAIATALGSPLQAGGAVTVTGTVAVDTVVKAVATNRGGLTQGGASAATVAAGGSGAVVGDVITLAGGTLAPGGLATQLTVTTVSSGAITGVSISRQGAYTAAPNNPVAQAATTGAGTGATFTMTYIPISFQIMPANTTRRGMKIKIPAASSGTLWFSGTGTVTTDYNSFDLSPGDYYASDPHEVGTGAINGIGSAIGLPFFAREF